MVLRQADGTGGGNRRRSGTTRPENEVDGR
ncbi:hypothetical protein W823_00125 [Williamsia sp. D3]|nr:hypothetical protein W823_00125 [Williamsia sp. D3]